MSWLFQPVLPSPILAHSVSMAGTVEASATVPSVAYVHRIRELVGLPIEASSGCTGDLKSGAIQLLAGVSAAISGVGDIAAKFLRRLLGISEAFSGAVGVLSVIEPPMVGSSAAISSIDDAPLEVSKKFSGVSSAISQVVVENGYAHRIRRFVEWIGV
jgi:uncharacterized membrane protein